MALQTVCAPVVLILGTMGPVVLGRNEPPADANVPQSLSEYLRHAAPSNEGRKVAFGEWNAALSRPGANPLSP